MTIKNTCIPLLIAAAFLLAGYVLYGSAGHDDSHITFWASYTLSEFGEILNYNGDRIEQSSSLLLTLLIAALAGLLGTDIVNSGYVITYLCGALAILLTWQLAHKTNPQTEQSLCAILLLATSPAFLLWNTSGMESTLAAACVLAFIWRWGDLLSGQRALGGRSLTLALLVTVTLITVRPEMIPLLATVVLLLFAWKRFSGTRGTLPLLFLYLCALCAIALLLAWRYVYFGSALPLPVYAKVSGFSAEKLQLGSLYLLHYGKANSIFLLACLLVAFYLGRLVYHRQNNTRIDYHHLLGALVFFCYSAFVLASGGDWMEAGRFLVPILPLAALACVAGIRQLLPGPWALRGITLLLVAFNLQGIYTSLKSESHGMPWWASYHITPQHRQNYSRFEQFNQEHLRDMDVIDIIDNSLSHFQPRPDKPITLMSGQAGMVFYYTAKKYFRRVRFYDSRSLVEDSLLRCSLSRDAIRSHHGLQIHHDGFFALQPALAERCGIPLPDLIYDINDISRHLPERIARHGYRLLHSEKNRMVEHPAQWPTNILLPVNFVMLREADDTPALPTTVTHYRDKPLVKRY